MDPHRRGSPSPTTSTEQPLTPTKARAFGEKRSVAFDVKHDRDKAADQRPRSEFLQRNVPSGRSDSPHQERWSTGAAPSVSKTGQFLGTTNFGDQEYQSIIRYSHYQNQQLKLLWKEAAPRISASQLQPYTGKGTQDRPIQFPLIRSLGPYQISKELGKGSTGKVFLAVHSETKEQVAIKCIIRTRPGMPPPKNTKETVAQREKRIYREAGILYLLKHPNIVSLRDFFVCDEFFCMIFEFVEGIQILDYIISNGKLKEKVACKFMRQIVSAVDYCHQNSIVHRDLKIENIMVDQVGNAQILDFGLANFYRPGEHLNTFCGSLYFAAPELLHGRVYTGPEVDVWSLGVIMFVLVTGRVPFDDHHMSVLHRKIKNCEITYPTHLSDSCVALLKRMINPDPKDRASMSEIINHAWLNQGYSYTVRNYMNERVPLAAIDETIVDFLAKEFRMIYNYEEIDQVLHKATENWAAVHNHPVVSLYYLTRDKKFKEGLSHLSLAASRPMNARSPSCPELLPYPPSAMAKEDASISRRTRNLTQSVPFPYFRRSGYVPGARERARNVEDELGKTRAWSATLAHRPPSMDLDEHAMHVRTVYLKGLFSVNSTSKKSPVILRQDLLALLLRDAIDFQDHGSVFTCEYQPSLKMAGDPPVDDGGLLGKGMRVDHLSKIGFEIHIVRVAVFGLYGILFKRLYGDITLYKSLSSQILAQLDL